jgi:lysyl-tRNA synthetase class 2
VADGRRAGSRRVFDIRFKTLSILRDRLEAQDFVEVETPILQPQADGAIARPFFTHANALDAEFSLRIAPELYLKRLVVGGYERVFEIARNFRNEGIDTRHSPEFTALEAYRAFGDFRDGMDLTEHLITEAAQGAAGRLDFDFGGQRIDLTPPWPRRDPSGSTPTPDARPRWCGPGRPGSGCRRRSWACGGCP